MSNNYTTIPNTPHYPTRRIKQSPAHANAGVYILAGKHNVAVIQAESQKNWHVSCGDICFLNYFTDKPEETSTKSFLVFKFQRSCDIQYNVSATYLVLIFTHGKDMFLEEKKKIIAHCAPPTPAQWLRMGVHDENLFFYLSEALWWLIGADMSQK